MNRGRNMLINENHATNRHRLPMLSAEHVRGHVGAEEMRDNIDNKRQ
jgi:hypothetical protein